MASELTVWQAVILGVVQGLTEWLPVSSSGHLVLTQAYLGLEAPLLFEALVHVGTLLVVLVFYRREVARMVVAVATLPRDVALARASPPAGAFVAPTMRQLVWDHQDRRLALLLVAGTVPTAIMGLTFRGPIEAAWSSTLVVGILLIATGTFLWSTRRARPRRSNLGWGDALLVGAAQGLAILPGVSRSGATIGAAMFRGLDRETAARYSFLLSVPAIVGATLLQGAGAWSTAWSSAYLAGVVAAMVVGYATLALLVAIVKRWGLHQFAWYCWGVGAIVVVAALT